MIKTLLKYKIKKLLLFQDGLVVHDFNILEINPDIITLEEKYTDDGVIYTDGIMYIKDDPIQPYFAQKDKKDEWLKFYNTLYTMINEYEKTITEI